MTEWYRYSIEQLQKKFGTDLSSGLDISSYRSIKHRRATISLNRDKTRRSRYSFVGSFSLLLLIFSAICLIFTSDPIFIPINLITLVSFIFIQILGWTAQATFRKNASSSSPKITVKRSGKERELSGNELVLGDLVLLQPGDIAFFDARLVYTKDLRVLEKHICGGDGVKSESFESYVPGLPPKEQRNMVFSGSVISSGKGYGIVCSVNREINEEHDSHHKNKLYLNVKRICERFGIFLLVFIIFYTLLHLVFSDAFKLLNAFTLSLTASSCTLCDLLPVFIDIATANSSRVICDVKKRQFATVQDISSISYIQGISVLVFDKLSSLCPSSPHIAKIFAYGDEFNAENKEHLRACRDVLYTAALAGGGEVNGSAAGTAIEDLLNSMHISSSLICDLYPIIEHRQARGLSLFDCSIVNYKRKHKLCCRGSAHHLLHRCSHILMSEKPVLLSNDELNTIISIAASYERKGSQLIVCASKYGDSFDDIRSGLCLEAIFVLPVEPTKQAAEAITQLKAAGIRPILFCDEITDSNYEMAKSLNIVRGETQALTAFELNANNLNILNLKMHNYRLFQGFSAKEKKYVLDQLKRNDGTKIGILSTNFSDAAYSDDESYTLFCVDPGNGEYRGAQALKYLSDVTLPNVSDEGGVVGAAKLINSIRSLLPRCTCMIRYLLFNGFCALILSILSGIFDNFSLSPSELIVSTYLTGIIGSISLIFGKSEKSLQYIPVSESISGKQIFGIFASSLICCITCMISSALPFILNNDLQLSSSVLFSSVLLSSITAFCLAARAESTIISKKEWHLAIPLVCTVIGITVLSYLLPNIYTDMGISCISINSLIYSVFPCLMLIALDLLFRIKRKIF